MTKMNSITGGVYLVVDPSQSIQNLLPKIEQALAAGVQVLQIWKNWPEYYDLEAKQYFIDQLLNIAIKYQVPVLINDEWELLLTTGLHGVHFDNIPADYDIIKRSINRPFLAGITCSNNLDLIHWAHQNLLDYLSFCAMFPSSSVNTCELVKPETVAEARKITDMPIFLSGGITPANLGSLKNLAFKGVAVIAGILNAEDPYQNTIAYEQVLKQLNK